MRGANLFMYFCIFASKDQKKLEEVEEKNIVHNYVSRQDKLKILTIY